MAIENILIPSYKAECSFVANKTANLFMFCTVFLHNYVAYHTRLVSVSKYEISCSTLTNIQLK